MIDKRLLIESVNYPMPFGKYKGVHVSGLSISYLEWFLNNGGFPKGKLGEMMALIYELKLNGLEEILENIEKENNYT